MSAITLVYNRVQDSVLFAEESNISDGIGAHLFATANINPEIVLYHWYMTTDNREIWLYWRTQIREWLKPDSVPEVVKLARMLTQ